MFCAVQTISAWPCYQLANDIQDKYKNPLINGEYKMKPVILIQAIAVSLVLVGCATFFGPKMGSRDYTPHSDQERVEFEKADRNIYPDDIRQDITKFKNTAIAWAGIIQEVSSIDEEDHMEMILLIEVCLAWCTCRTSGVEAPEDK